VIERHCSLPRAPNLISRYSTHKGLLLGSGAYGQVYQAKLKDGTDRPVAIKIINKAVLGKKPADEALCVFREIAVLRHIEAALPAAVKDRTVSFVEAYATAQYVIIATELCSRKDLLQRICDSRGSLRVLHELNIAWILRELCIALAGLHAAGIVHRDIKPENVLTIDRPSVPVVPSDGLPQSPPPTPPSRGNPGFRVVLADFGFAHSPGLFSRDLFRGRRLGTPTFTAPEVVRSGEHSPAADMWSLGTVAHVLCAGNVPFVARSWAEARTAMDERPVSLSGPTWEARSDACRDFVGALLRAEPSDRMTARAALSHPFLAQIDWLPERGGAASAPAPSSAAAAMDELRVFTARRRWQKVGAACAFGCLHARVRQQAMRGVPLLNSALGSGGEEPGDGEAPTLETRAPGWATSLGPGDGDGASVGGADDEGDAIGLGSAVPPAPLPVHRSSAVAAQADASPVRVGVRRLVRLFRAEAAGPGHEDGSCMTVEQFRSFVTRHLIEDDDDDTDDGEDGDDDDDSASDGRSTLSMRSGATARPAAYPPTLSGLPPAIGRRSPSSAAAAHPNSGSSSSPSSPTPAANAVLTSSSSSSSAAAAAAVMLPTPDRASVSEAGPQLAPVLSGNSAAPQVVNSMALDALCAVFDRNGDGSIDVSEFCAGLSQLPASRATALHLLFDLADSDGDGRLSAEEIADVMRAQAGPNMRQEVEKGAAAALMLERADTDHDGYLSLAELRAALRANKEVRQALLAPTRGSDPPAAAAVPGPDRAPTATAAHEAEEGMMKTRGAVAAAQGEAPQPANARLKRPRDAGTTADAGADADKRQRSGRSGPVPLVARLAHR